MIQFWILMLGQLLSVVVQPQTNKPARLSGKISHAPSDFIVLLSSSCNDTIPLAADGTFAFTMDVKVPDMYSLYIPASCVYASVFMENGKHNYFEVDIIRPQEVKIEGDLKEIYAYVGERRKLFRQLSQRNVENFSTYDRLLGQATDSLTGIARRFGDEYFYNYEHRQLNQEVDHLKVRYFNLLGNQNKELDSDTAYNRFMETIDVNDEANLATHRSFAYLQWKASCRNKKVGTDYYEMLKILHEKVKNRSVADDLAFRLARIYLTSGQKQHADETYKMAMELLSAERGQELEDLYTKLTTELVPDVLAPDFEMMTPEGKMVRFSEVWGKVIYLDIWSTWCGPCCKEIPYVAKLAEHYKDNENIEFISISLDRNLKDWQNFLQKHDTSWKQFVIPDKQRDTFLKLYGINGIPRFMMFSKEGRIIDIHAPRPSSEKIIEFIDNYL